MFIDVNGKKLHYTKKGSKKTTILLVHGWGGSVSSLEKLQELLSEDFSVIAVDLPGFGESDLPDSAWGADDYAECVHNFIKNLGLTEVIYFGHSFGGALGVYLAANYPNTINKLILAAPSYKRPQPIKKHFTTDFFLKINNKTRRWPFSKTFRHIYYKLFLPHSDLPKHPKLEQNFKKIVARDLTPLIKDVKSKTLILWGDKDSSVPISDAYLLNKEIKNSKLKVFKGLRHGFPLNSPEFVCREIKEFV